LGNFDFSTAELGGRALEGLFASHNYDNWSICPNLMGAIGLGKGFVIATECTCDGATTSGTEIACKYSVCVVGIGSSQRCLLQFWLFVGKPMF
jgi:hypothetical protein